MDPTCTPTPTGPSALERRMASHCGTGNSPSPRFPGREVYFEEKGYAAQLVILSCMDCGEEIARYSQMRPLVRNQRPLSYRKDTGHPYHRTTNYRAF